MDSEIWYMRVAFLFLITFAVLNVIYFFRRRSGRQERATKAPDNSRLDDSSIAEDPKPSIWHKDVTVFAGILFGIPVLLVFGLVAMAVGAASGQGVGVFILIFLGLCVWACLKVLSR